VGKAFWFGGIAAIGAIALGCGAVIATSHPRRPPAVKRMFAADAGSIDDPELVAAITRGGPPLPTPPVPSAPVAPKAMRHASPPTMNASAGEPGPTLDELDQMGSKTEAQAVVTESPGNATAAAKLAVPQGD
jgi:hypothetical protein